MGFVARVERGSSFWTGVLTDMKARGVNDILITTTDNLNGFTETVKTVSHNQTLKYALSIRSEMHANLCHIKTESHLQLI
ncbi:MAG: transposase [Saprospiraceae bacterium]|nr:transposase [Candidatus Brachybacter algidus]